MADKKAQLPGEPLLDYIQRIGTGEYVKRLSQEKVANKLKSDERKSGQFDGYEEDFKFRPFKKKTVKQGGFAPNTEYTGSFIDGTFDDLNVSNKSYLKYYKDLLK
jgi:hypothetical protein